MCGLAGSLPLRTASLNMRRSAASSRLTLAGASPSERRWSRYASIRSAVTSSASVAEGRQEVPHVPLRVIQRAIHALIHQVEVREYRKGELLRLRRDELRRSRGPSSRLEKPLGDPPLRALAALPHLLAAMPVLDPPGGTALIDASVTAHRRSPGPRARRGRVHATRRMRSDAARGRRGRSAAIPAA